jgi:hypothetical protein
MAVARNAPCPCGSGRKYKLCHGSTRTKERAERRRLEALEEAQGLGALFPMLRPRGDAIAAFADRVADELGAHDGEIPEERVDEGLEHVDEAERRRLVAAYSDGYPGPWRSLCAEVGDRALTERALVASAVRAAIGERRLPPRGVLEEVEEEEAVLDSPANVLAFLLSPANVWSIEDAVVAGDAAEGLDVGPEWFEVVDEIAETRLERAHPERVRKLARHIARRLPLKGLPRVSALLAEGCKEVERDPALAEELAVMLLSTYLVHLSVTPVTVG